MAPLHSTSEIGHAKNVANYQTLLNYCNNFGATYNPPNTAIEVAQMQTIHGRAQTEVTNVHTKLAELDLAYNTRQAEFAKLDPLVTRIINMLEVATNDPRIVDDARTFVNKIRGRLPNPQTDENQDGQETQRTISNSQQSYDNLINHFDALLQLLILVPQYTPSETDLRITALETFLDDLRSANQNVELALVNYEHALNQRDKILYDPIDGLVQNAKLVKKYVKALYGATSLEYTQLSDIEFRTFKR